jgi:hypothetical protein
MNNVQTTTETPLALNRVVSVSAVNDWLLKNGFAKYHGDEDYDCVMRLHVLHFLFWSDNLKHFSIGVLNDTGKKEAGGFYKKWKMVMIPKPIYTVEQAECLLKAIT